MSWFQRLFSGASERSSDVDRYRQIRALFNQPQPDRDDGRRERDPLVIAERMVRGARRRQEISHAAPLVQALWFLAARRQPIPALADPAMATLAAITRMTEAGDEEGVFAQLTSASASWYPWLLRGVGSIVGRRFPERLAQFRTLRGDSSGAVHMDALGARQPAMCEALLDAATSRDAQVSLTLLALLAALDAGRDASKLEARWLRLRPTQLEQDGDWHHGEIERLARIDLDAATRYRQAVLELHEEDPETAIAYFTRYARHHGRPQALRHALAGGEAGSVTVPRLIGCARAGVSAGDAMRLFVDDIHEFGYAPHILFRYLVRFALETNATSLLEATLRGGGAHSWQIAQAAGPVVQLSHVREAPAFPAMLELCLAAYPPGPVAGRDDSDGGRHVGQCEAPPSWLAFDEPKPIEWLLLSAVVNPASSFWVTR